MAATKLKPSLLTPLDSDAESLEVGAGEKIFLTPYLVLACCLLYMMAADGELEAEESSQLQAVLGGDEAVRAYAMRYVQSVPVAQFFETAGELLSVKDKWCILVNVCDALLSDGHADRAELALFAQMIKAFGIREVQFEPYFKILALKNDKSVLGKYTGVKEERQPMTPHFALAIALLYMLTADGSIGEQEVGQLEAVIGEFDGLQNVALKYVRSVKLKQFLDEAAALLRPEQKIYILTNVCDSMLSDGEVANLEDKLFFSMMTAFGFTEKTFARYLQVLEVKNLKPFDTSAFKNRVVHDRVLAEDDAEGVMFTNELADASVHSRAQRELPDSANQGVWVEASKDTAMSQFIARTMQDNIQSVSDDFGHQDNVVKVGLNATDEFNLQKLDEVTDASKNRQQIKASLDVDNLQKVDSSQQDLNRQQIDVFNAKTNQQLIEKDVLSANFQEISIDIPSQHRESIDPEVRVNNIHEVVQEVNHRLDRFETEHFKFLQIGRTEKFTDAFVLIDDEISEVNRQLVDESFARMGLDVIVDLAPDDSSGDKVALKTDLSDVAKIVVDDGTLGDVPLSSGAEVDEGNLEEAHGSKMNVLARLYLYFGSSFWTDRGHGFRYVQMCVAAITIVFASPIDTRAALGRGVAGPLITAPAFAPELRDHRKVLEAELNAASRSR